MLHCALPARPAGLGLTRSVREQGTCSRTNGIAPSVRSPSTASRRVVTVQARRYDPDDDKRKSDGMHFKFGKTEINIDKDDVSGLLIPGAIALGIGTFVIGPVLLSLAVSAAAVGFAVTIGATTLLIPAILFSGFMFTFGGAFFFTPLLFAGLGVVASLLKVGLIGAGIYGGWRVANFFMLPATSNDATPASGSIFDVKDAETVEDEESKRVKTELDDFDRLLREREQQRKKMDDFRR